METFRVEGVRGLGFGVSGGEGAGGGGGGLGVAESRHASWTLSEGI